MQVSEVAPKEEVSMMDGSLVLAPVSTGASVLNGIGLLVTWIEDCGHFFTEENLMFVRTASVETDRYYARL